MQTLEEYKKTRKQLSNWSYYNRKKQQAVSEAELFKSACDSRQCDPAKLLKWTDHFTETGKKFGLTKEFQKMGII